MRAEGWLSDKARHFVLVALIKKKKRNHLKGLRFHLAKVNTDSPLIKAGFPFSLSLSTLFYLPLFFSW